MEILPRSRDLVSWVAGWVLLAISGVGWIRVAKRGFDLLGMAGKVERVPRRAGREMRFGLMVCGCSLRTQQGALKASANYGNTPADRFGGQWEIPLATFLLPGQFFNRFCWRV